MFSKNDNEIDNNIRYSLLLFADLFVNSNALSQFINIVSIALTL